MCRYNTACDGCYFKETKDVSDRFSDCWDCELVPNKKDKNCKHPSNYVQYTPYYE